MRRGSVASRRLKTQVPDPDQREDDRCQLAHYRPLRSLMVAGSLYKFRLGELGRVHINLRASTMSAKERKARKTTSSFSKREKMRRNPLSLRNSRSISLR